MPRPSNTEQRREEIVDGLLRTMAERGYAGASIAAIAEAAALSPGLVHYHFESKQSILVALVDRLAARLRERYGERSASVPDEPRARLGAFVDAHLALGEGADPAAVACWVAVGSEAVRQPEVRAVYARVVAERLDTLSGLFGAALRAEGRSTRRAREMAAAVLAAIEGSYQLASTVPGSIPPGTAARTVRRIADGLLAAEPRRG